MPINGIVLPKWWQKATQRIVERYVLECNKNNTLPFV